MVASCPARGMGVEIGFTAMMNKASKVMPREGHGSRNKAIMPAAMVGVVMPREGHGSRNVKIFVGVGRNFRHAPRGAWE